ncbi:MAG: argininosuccinate lyase, partial [Elusimicrobiota bacterium]|nr:argininosuccinate lyase [Elusimicrobiota bacterium]
MAKTMWGGRFKKDTFKTMETFNASIDFDKRLYACDIKGSIAHAKMLAKCGIISKSDAAKIEKGLKEILADISKGNFVFKKELEDIHMNIEAELTKRIGNAGARLHTARSRNDQVATDMHLYVKEEILILRPMILDLMQSVLNLAQNNFAIIFPAMTHLQHAQPIRFPQHALAYFFMFNRDLERLDFVYKHTDFCPLGAGAVAGTTFKIDRQFSA